MLLNSGPIIDATGNDILRNLSGTGEILGANILFFSISYGGLFGRL
ncbi:hypothetical protein J4217_01505 [Candidatus Pacearchaeota archaeon]|nr:hypothetical protein [Candidatus Pacearchaeota archaeon]